MQLNGEEEEEEEAPLLLVPLITKAMGAEELSRTQKDLNFTKPNEMRSF